MNQARAPVIARLAQRLLMRPCSHPMRVAIDGVDAAGKTSLADELAAQLRQSQRSVIRASIDGFHQPRAVRYQRGDDSPESYYLDSFNLSALIEDLLEPLGPDGTGQYRPRHFDFRSDALLETPQLIALPDAILLFDGVFLLRPELQPYWEHTIFVQASFEVTLARAMTRDLELFGSTERIFERYQSRYIPGQKLYLEQVQPQQQADFIVMNDDPAAPELVERGT